MLWFNIVYARSRDNPAPQFEPRRPRSFVAATLAKALLESVNLIASNSKAIVVDESSVVVLALSKGAVDDSGRRDGRVVLMEWFKDESNANLVSHLPILFGKKIFVDDYLTKVEQSPETVVDGILHLLA